jgi:hypothetical protein
MGRSQSIPLTVVLLLLAVSACGTSRNIEAQRVADDIRKSAEPIKVWDGTECRYDGATEFDLNDEVTFTFVNESDDTGVGFVVWTVPDGTTAEYLKEFGDFGLGPTPYRGTDDSLFFEGFEAKYPPTQLGAVYQVTVSLDRAGLYSVNCFVESATELNIQYATIVTVSG